MVKMIAGEEDVNAAIQILDEKIGFIGFTEYFYESLLLLKDRLLLDDFKVIKTVSKMTSKDIAKKGDSIKMD